MDSKNKNYMQTCLGIGAGILTYNAGNKIIHKRMKYLANKKPVYSQDQFDYFYKIANEVLQKEFKDSNIKIRDINEEDQFYLDFYNKRKIYYKNELAKIKNPIKKFYKKRLFQKYLKYDAYNRVSLRQGSNAAYAPIFKNGKVVGGLITVNKKTGSILILHEFGHFLNFERFHNYEFFMKHVVKSKYLKYLTPLLLGISLITNPKNKENKKDNPLQKFARFIKNNSAKIYFTIVGLPYIFNEICANIHGQKLALKYVDKHYLKHYTKSHLKSSIYNSGFLIACSSLFFAVNKVRDFICKNKKVKKT